MSGWRLIAWFSGKNRARSLIIVGIVAAALTTYTILGAVLKEMSAQVVATHHLEEPWDVSVKGYGAHEVADAVRGIKGVMSVGEAYLFQSIMHNQIAWMVAFAGPDPLGTTYVRGRAPSDIRDIALPGQLAESLEVGVGDPVWIVPMGSTDKEEFLISGIIAPGAGELGYPLVTVAGAALLARDMESVTALLVTLDGLVSLDKVRSGIRALGSGFKIEASGDQYAYVQRSAGLAELIVKSVRFLILTVSAASVAALSYVAERERAYQLGVLRAMGAGKPVLLATTGFRSFFLALIGVLVSAGAVQILHPLLGIGTAHTWGSFPQAAGIIGVVSLLAVLAVSSSLIGRPIRALLTDSWGK